MAFDAFLKLDGIDGESNDARHPGEIEILAYAWGLSNTVIISGGGGGGGAGKASFQDVRFDAATSKASPVLALRCATGAHIPTATLTLRKQGGTPFEFIKVVLTQVSVTSYEQAGSTDGNTPQDSFSLFFEKIEFDDIPQKADGTADTPVVFKFDLAGNKAG